MSRRAPALALLLLPLVLQVAALVALGHDCSSPGDCEETAGYNGAISVIGGIIAIIAGILGTHLGGALPGVLEGTTAAPPLTRATTPATATPAGPDVLMDPWEGKPLTTWDPTKYGPGADGKPGQPGWVWWGGNWISPDDARDRIKASLDADKRRASEDKAFADDSARLSDQWMKDRERQLQKEADEEKRRREAEDTLKRVQDIARTRGDEEIWKRTLDNAYGPNGIDPDYVDRLKNTLRQRIGEGVGEPQEPQKSWIREATENTINDALHNPIIRVGTDILTGGTAEIYFTGQSAWDAMRHAAEDAARKGKDIDFTDAFRAGIAETARDKLPINTISTLVQKGRDASWTDIGGSIIKDLGTVPGLVETGRNLGKSLEEIGKGNIGGSLTAKADPLNLFGRSRDPAEWPGQQYDGPLRTRGIKGIPEGTKVAPDEFGMPPMSGRQAQMVADKYGVDIKVRPTNPDAIKRLADGDLPKPMKLKAKTIDEFDTMLGAPEEHIGRVGYFPPKMPSTIGMDPEDIVKLQQRFLQRSKEFNGLSKDMAVLQASGDVQIQNGVVVDGATGKYFTGDHDLYSITNAGGGRLPAAIKQQIVNDLRGGPFKAQHGAHTDWQYDPLDPSHGQMNLNIDTKIRADHAIVPPDPSASLIDQVRAGGNTPLVQFGGFGGPPQASYSTP
jgi:hypothetical protein